MESVLSPRENTVWQVTGYSCWHFHTIQQKMTSIVIIRLTKIKFVTHGNLGIIIIVMMVILVIITVIVIIIILRTMFVVLSSCWACHCKSCGDRCFATAGPRVWNSLPAELQQCSSLRQFKRCLKTSIRVVGLRHFVTLCNTVPYRNSLTYLLT